ncbi:MAG: flagellar basal body protein [Oceanococcaceae bacterium]
MTQLFDIGRSALSSYQQALTAVSRNVANANTPGYARQSVNFRELAGGGGVDVVSLNRSADNSALASARDAVEERAFAEVRANALTRIDALISDDSTGLGAPLRRLSESVDAFAAAPTDIAVRQTLLANADGFAAQVRMIDDTLVREANQAGQQLGVLAASAQDQLDELAQIQGQLDRTERMDAATATLMDRRDVLLEGLAETLGVRSQINGNGTLQVTLGNGQPVIEAGQAVRLGVGADAEGQLQITTNGNLQPSRVIGGEAGGLLQLMHTDIPAAQDQLGRVAQSVAAQFNTAQVNGADLEGNVGTALFVEATPRVRELSNNAGTAVLGVTGDDSAELPASRMRLSFDGAAWSATDSRGATLPMAGSGTAGDPFTVGGVAINVTGVAAAGDSFMIEPAPASGFVSNALRPEELAAAAAGSAPNSGDNSNATALQETLRGGFLDGGRTSVQDANVNWISDTGQRTASALSAVSVARASESFALDRRDSIQGVNLDEEAADLLRYQQAYAAAAQVLATAGTLFDSVLAAMRR